MNMWRTLACVLLFLSMAPVSLAEPTYQLHSFQRLQLTDQFYCEGASAADLNRDGHVDIISGPYWYAGPDFTERKEYYAAKPFSIDGYSDNFFTFTFDINGDQWLDILLIGFPGKEAYWYENPRGGSDHWTRHLAFASVDNESPSFVDLTGDGKPELVFHTAGRFGYAEIPTNDPKEVWEFQPISPDRGYDRFNHGLGVGDVNGDGKADLLEKAGWWEQPSLISGSEWTFHEVPFAADGGAQMLVSDLDGDGDNDVVTSKSAHGYGLAWFENVCQDGVCEFVEHPIMGEHPHENDYGVVFSQLHALALTDIDGDGVKDIVTGKRFWAHQGHDPGGHDPAVSYWFKTVREQGKVQFVPYLIDSNSGVGTQLVVKDVNGDQWLDLVVGNKKGTFALLHHTKEVDLKEWNESQPVPLEDNEHTAANESDRSEDGIVARNVEGHPLNLDFEKGDSRDWIASGPAFKGQPIWGDTVHARRPTSISGHQGDRWIGTFEVEGDAPTGTMKSTSFPVSHQYAAFYVGGGSSHLTRVEIVRQDTEEIIFVASGRNSEQMRPVTIDLREQQGQEIFIRIVDESSGPWGHINFDHFRFYQYKPQISVLEQQQILPLDEYPHAGLPALRAAQEMILPEGFHVAPFASEPDVKQPIAMALDDRGRIWIAEAYEYPQRVEEGSGRDRILILEDTDGDGRLDTRKVFAEGLNLVSGLEVGFGGVWVGAAPYLLFIPDRNGDDLPDAKPQVLLDGWGYQDTHETLNSFIWGPDGWLYGCHGVFTHSRVGKPGTRDNGRTPLNAGIWRYHPTRHEFEIFAHGTSNPWGVDFDDHGQAVSTVCVIPHLFHIIQGARYHRQAGEHFNKHTYDDIKTIADHFHYLGNTPHSGNEKSDSNGGGHAHAGAMIYLGGAWPQRYRSQIMMNNIHGQRLNADILSPRGSGLVGSHGDDFLLTQDRASQMLAMRYGPDGQVYVIDWYDMQACHDGNASAHDRSNGRVYKVTFGEPAPIVTDLSKKLDRELAELVLNENDWYVRHSRRLLQERSAERGLKAAAHRRLVEIATTHADETRRLRAAWVLHATGSLETHVVRNMFADESAYVRAWAIQLSLDGATADADLLECFARLAREDHSPVVRLYLASALQKIAYENRWTILEALVTHQEDATDHNLPLMYWYAAEPLAEVDLTRSLEFGLSCGNSIPMLRDFMLRRIAKLASPESLATLVNALGKSQTDNERLSLLAAIRDALKGHRRVESPASWSGVYAKLANASQDVRTQATFLGASFGDSVALSALRKLIRTNSSDINDRREALETLLEIKDPQLVDTLQQMLLEPTLRDLALTGLAAYSDPATPTAVLAVYDSFSPSEKRQALAALASRSSYGNELLQAVADGIVPSTDMSADLVRQLHSLGDEKLSTLLNDLWGTVRSTAKDKTEQIKAYHELLNSPAAADADPELGRAIFAKTCQQCHTLYGVGETIGPDLTGSNRSNLDYLLSNIVDPSAVISKEYQNTVILTDGGRVLTGIVSAEDDQAITFRTTTETLVLSKEEIEERTLSELSMMPDNQLKQFSPHEVLSLVAYLRGRLQVPLLATKDNASMLFNGRDLTNWKGDSNLWSVEDGEIVGRTTGLEENSFLISELTAEDFELSLEVMLKENAGNSGIQFRSRQRKGFKEMHGYQADIGPGWWGKLYEEHGRELLWEESGEEFAQSGRWNSYKIRAVGSRIQTWLNGQLCVDLDDPTGARRGVFALQIHSGGQTEVRFKNLRLEISSGGSD
ncbi:PVC-type heme-binding CxxCH protein [Adhaeretor mobilis]|nr:PVC-type heme-binding CxxCH protein [Adhaeretor mobilis]